MGIKLFYKKSLILSLVLVSSNIFVAADEDTFFDDVELNEDSSGQNDSRRGLDLDFSDLLVKRSCQPGEAANWLLIINGGLPGIPPLAPMLDQQIYKKTSVPVSRNLINYPAFQLPTYHNYAPEQYSVHVLYNQTSNKSFAAIDRPGVNELRLGSYLNIKNDPILSTLEQIFDSPLLPTDLKASLNSINFPKVADTFAAAHLEERRLAIMNHFVKQFHSGWTFEFRLPIVWMIRNLNFTQQEKNTLQKEFSAFLGDSSFDENAFARKHFVMDAFGLGTLDLSVYKTVFTGDNWHVDLGGSLLLPTDRHMAQGWYGTYFEPNDCQPSLSLCDIVDTQHLTVAPNGKQVIENFFLGALNKLSSIVLQCPLGNEEHVGVALKMLAFWDIHENFSLNSSYSFEYLFPQVQQRFFVLKDTKKFSKIYNALPETTAQEQEYKLNFFTQRLIDLFYPRVAMVKFFPGFIFASTNSLKYVRKAWAFFGGYSSWYKSDEQIYAYSRNQPVNLDHYDLDKAVNAESYAVKLFAKIQRDIYLSRRAHDLSVALWADATVFNKGVGNDFSLGLSATVKF